MAFPREADDDEGPARPAVISMVGPPAALVRMIDAQESLPEHVQAYIFSSDDDEAKDAEWKRLDPLGHAREALGGVPSVSSDRRLSRLLLGGNMSAFHWFHLGGAARQEAIVDELNDGLANRGITALATVYPVADLAREPPATEALLIRPLRTSLKRSDTRRDGRQAQTQRVKRWEAAGWPARVAQLLGPLAESIRLDVDERGGAALRVVPRSGMWHSLRSRATDNELIAVG